MVLVSCLTCIGCYGLSLFFKRAGDDIAKNLVWGVLVVVMLDYPLALLGFETLRVLVRLSMFVLMIYIFIALREPLQIIGRTGWSRLWLFVPIINIMAPYQWAAVAKEFEERTETFEPENAARDLNRQAKFLRTLNMYDSAERLYKQALEIQEEAFGLEHPEVAATCENMAELYKKMGKEDEAERLEARARKIQSNL